MSHEPDLLAASRDVSPAIEASLCPDVLPEAVAMLGGIEACGSAHHWLRELKVLGHTDRLIPPAYVKPYVKRQKDDAADAEAICEAVNRANMRFVTTKTAEQQSGLVLHRARHLFIRQQTSVITAIRAHLAEFGIVAPLGCHGVEELLTVVADSNDRRVPEIARACLSALGAQLRRIKEQILEFDRLIKAWHRSNEMSMRLEEAPGFGPVLATALVAAAADPKSFRSGRNFSAWIGIVPKQHSSGGKNRLGNISNQGDRYLRGLFVAGARSVIRYAKIHGTKHRPWLTAFAETDDVENFLADVNADRGQECSGHELFLRMLQGSLCRLSQRGKQPVDPISGSHTHFKKFVDAGSAS